MLLTEILPLLVSHRNTDLAAWLKDNLLRICGPVATGGPIPGGPGSPRGPGAPSCPGVPGAPGGPGGPCGPEKEPSGGQYLQV